MDVCVLLFVIKEPVKTLESHKVSALLCCMIRHTLKEVCGVLSQQ